MKLNPFHMIFLAAFVMLGCNRFGQVLMVEREDLFALGIGRLEDQIALFDVGGGMLRLRRADVAMRDGLFFISDSNGGKILRFNSYGDLLFMIYNDETNPQPLTLSPLEEGSLATRWSVSHPLLEPSSIRIDSRNHIFVQERLPPERHSFDTERNVLLDSVVLHFDSEGRFIDYIGREGIGGTPFPQIEGLFTTVQDEIVVVSRIPLGWTIYWFDANGLFLFEVRLGNDALPVPPDREGVVVSSLDTISAGHNARRLYVKIDYYRHIYDGSTGAITGIEPDSSVIWVMNGETGVWERYVDLPFFEHTFTVQNRRVVSRKPYSLIGITRSERAFLSFPTDGGYSIRVMPLDPGRAGDQARAFIEVDSSEMQFNAFDLSADGILSALLASDWQVKLVWWRTDRFFGG
ncbi:MAG: hypothetical protein LBG93_06260 [Treponema sp.]|jgi:hypothetical protein|nr:hypothetical protein [Treponema sp.]